MITVAETLVGYGLMYFIPGVWLEQDQRKGEFVTERSCLYSDIALLPDFIVMFVFFFFFNIKFQ